MLILNKLRYFLFFSVNSYFKTLRMYFKHLPMIFGAIALSLNMFAQQNIFMHSPKGLADKAMLDPLKSEILSAPSEAELSDAMNHPEKNGDLYVIARLLSVQYNTLNSGQWKYYEDGSKLWRLQVEVENARGLDFYFSKLEIPKGAVIHTYSPNTELFAKPIFENPNLETSAYATPIVTGSTVVLEYFQPADVKGNPVIEVEAVGYYFRGIEFVSDFIAKDYSDNGASASCMVNANCSEGSSFQNQKRATVKLIVRIGNSAGLCSGAMINNTAQDCKRYLLTAQHCGASASTANLGQWKFYFNFESPNCANVTSATANTLDNQVLTGCSKRAASGTTSDVSHSDFLLLELSSTIPTAYNVYYAGWDRNTTAASSGVGFHHPSGDIKKVSTYTTSLQSGTWTNGVTNAHWVVRWAQTTNGHAVTEGGSSGSPLFNSAGRIVGDLSGGSSYCSTPNNPDLYGKFSYSWTSAGTTNDRQLKPWLDPNNTGAFTLDGRNACDGTTPTEPGPSTGCDTSGNFINGVHSPVLLNTSQGGYIGGTNPYGDLAKAERFSVTSGYKLKALLYGFGFKSGSGNVAFKVWNSGANGPGTELSSTTVALSQIPVNGSLTMLDFSANPITVGSSFFAGVTLPTGSGNALALYTTNANVVTGNTGWEQYSDGVWHPYADGYTANYAHVILYILCPPDNSNPTSISEEEIVNGLTLFPNPASTDVHIVSQNGQNITSVKIIDMTGKTIVHNTKNFDSVAQLNIGQLSNGIYQVMVQVNNQSWVAKKLVISK